MKKGLVLDRVVLLGRTLEEYRRYFDLDLERLHGKRVLDVAAGVSSFCAEASAAGLQVTAVDPIYALSADEIRRRCEPDLDEVVEAFAKVETYRWKFYGTPEKMRTYRERAFRSFLADYEGAGRQRYVAGSLPRLPFESATFDLTLSSYFLFVYEDRFDYSFHQQALTEILRVTRGEVRLYPIVNFETHRSSHLDRFSHDPLFADFRFEVVPTDFEFLANSNFYLRVTRR